MYQVMVQRWYKDDRWYINGTKMKLEAEIHTGWKSCLLHYLWVIAAKLRVKTQAASKQN